MTVVTVIDVPKYCQMSPSDSVINFPGGKSENLILDMKKLYPGMVHRILSPKAIHIQTCEYITFHGKGTLQMCLDMLSSMS